MTKCHDLISFEVAYTYLLVAYAGIEQVVLVEAGVQGVGHAFCDRLACSDGMERPRLPSECARFGSPIADRRT